MVRTDNLSSFYRHNAESVGDYDQNNYGSYNSPVKKSNYYKTLTNQFNNTQRKRPPPPAYPPSNASGPYRRTRNAESLAHDYTPPQRHHYQQRLRQERQHMQQQYYGSNQSNKSTLRSSGHSDAPSTSSGQGWQHERARKPHQRSTAIDAMNLSPRGGAPGESYFQQRAPREQRHPMVNTPYESPYKINNIRKWRVNKTAGKKSGTIQTFGLAKSAVSEEGPNWWMTNRRIPINKTKPKENKFKTEFGDDFFVGAAGYKTGALLDDSAQSSDGPDWMTRLPHVPRPPIRDAKKGWKTDFGDKCFVGAAGMRTGAVLDDTAESGDSPRWMRLIPGVGRSKDPRDDPNTKQAKRDFLGDYTPSRLGVRSGAVLDDSAVSGDAPSFFHIKGVPKSKMRAKKTGHKTEFKPSTGAGMRTFAANDDSAISDDVPDFMCIPGVPRMYRPAPQKAHHQRDEVRDFQGAAGAALGSCPDDSAISRLAPQWMHIPGIPTTKKGTLRQPLDGFQGNGTFGGYANKNLKTDFTDTAISENAPAFMHIPGIPHVKDKSQRELMMKSVNFDSHCQGGDSTISNSAPDWMRHNKHVPIARDEYTDWGVSKHTFMGGEVGKGLKSDPRVFKQPCTMADNHYKNTRSSSLGKMVKPPETQVPHKFPLGGSIKKTSVETAPVDSMKGPISHAKADGDMLPLGMQGAITFGNPATVRTSKHLSPRITKLAREQREVPHGILLYGGNAKGPSSVRPQTKMKGSVSFAKNDLDRMPMRTWGPSSTISPRARRMMKSRLDSREVGVADLAGNKPGARLRVDQFGSGNHSSFTSKDTPSWMDGGPKTARPVRAKGKGGGVLGLNGADISVQSPRWMQSSTNAPRPSPMRHNYSGSTGSSSGRYGPSSNGPQTPRPSMPYMPPPSTSKGRNQRLFTPAV